MSPQLSAYPTSGATHRPSFLQRSTSIASLLAWKDRFECFSGKFVKEPSFVSHAGDVLHNLPSSKTFGTSADPPSEYGTVVSGNPEIYFKEKTVPEDARCGQNFGALEDYLKKKLSFKKKGSIKERAGLETARVFQWIHELPEGDNLEEFLEAYGLPTKGVDMGDLKERLRVFIDERLAATNVDLRQPSPSFSIDENQDEIPQWQRQINDLKGLAHGDNLEKWLESLDVPFFRPIPEIKSDIRKYLNLPKEEIEVDLPENNIPVPETVDVNIPDPPTKEIEEFVPKWKELVEKMGELKSEKDLDKWLENLDIPHNVEKSRIHAEIKKFFRHETFENFAGKSVVFKEKHLAKKLWDKLEDSSLLKQVAVVAGTTAVLGVIAVLSTSMLSLAVPAAFAINPFFIEVFAQYFLQRHEVAFNLLNFHAANAKPLSTAWAKQYVLWKYC